MKKTLLLFLILLVGYNITFGQESYFKETDNSYEAVYTFNIDQLMSVLNKAPLRGTSDAPSLVLTFPNLEGEMERYLITEAPIMASDLQANYPEIRSYSGIGIDSPSSYLRFSISPYKGLYGIVISGEANKSVIIESLKEDVSSFKILRKSDYDNLKDGKMFVCSTLDELQSNQKIMAHSNQTLSADGILHTFDLALSVTGEYTAYHGGTIADANAAMVATMTVVNAIFETDFNVTMVIINGNDAVVYTDGSTDPYSDPNIGTAQANSNNLNGWNLQLQNTLSSVLGNNAYDIGHLFGDSGGGGNAGCIGCVCNNDNVSNLFDKNKGSAYTSPGDGVPEGPNFDIDYVAHEMGHQFGANHTFSFSSETAGIAQMEPGSGSTIMGYAGITGATDLQPHSDPYFHAISIQQVTAHVATRTCDIETNTGNSVPVANAGNNYILPNGTPFKLTGSATDADASDNLTYCWEQFDENNGLNGYPSETSTNSNEPLFRSYTPTNIPYRVFPRMEDLLNFGVNGTQWEKIPTVARSADFRLTVRDNKPGGGANDNDDMQLTWTSNAGPFIVTSQVEDQLVWTPNDVETITWNVAGTTGNGINTSSVNILLSTDGGLTYDTVLASNVPNNGSYNITVPNLSAPYCRIMVEAVGSIFFNINTKDFAIGNYTYAPQNVCEDYTFDLNAAITESSDNSYPGTLLPITDSYTITDIKTYADISHPNIGQVNILFWFPWSASLNTGIWYNQTACTNADMDKWFDLAGVAPTCSTNGGDAFLPYSAANFNGAIGQNSAGEWRIYFKDVVVDGSGGVFNTFTIQLCHEELLPILSTDSFDFDDLAVYPNPNNGTFNIKMNALSNTVKVSVYDMRGRQIFLNDFQANGRFDETINLQNTQSGMYLLNIQDDQRKITKKIIIE